MPSLEFSSLLLLAIPVLVGTAAGERPVRELAAWVTYWDFGSGMARLTGGGRGVGDSSSVHDVFLFTAALTPEGGITLVGDERPIVAAVGDLESRGTNVWLTVVNDVHPSSPGATPTLKDAALVRRLLEDPEKSERHQRELVALARRLGVSGIDIDYEKLAYEDRLAFTRFIANLSMRTRNEGLFLSVTVSPKTGEVRSAGPGGTDWSGLCPLVDRLQIMLYNLHSNASGPGPIATPEWISKVLTFALSECPASRVVPALKVSGMDWGPRGADGIQYQQSIALAERLGANIQRDPSDVPYFHYDESGEPHTVFFEDAESIEAKVRAIEGLGFDRVILWSLGREDPSLLQRLGDR